MAPSKILMSKNQLPNPSPENSSQATNEPPETALERVLPDGSPPARLAPHIIYAIGATGMIVTERNQHIIAKRRLHKWNRAIDEYFRRTKKVA